MGKIRYAKKLGKGQYYTTSGTEAGIMICIEYIWKIFYWILYGIFFMFKGGYLGCKWIYKKIKEKRK